MVLAGAVVQLFLVLAIVLENHLHFDLFLFVVQHLSSMMSMCQVHFVDLVWVFVFTFFYLL